jgi:NTE family protein
VNARRLAPWIVGCLSATLSGCAHRVTPRLAKYDLNVGYRFDRLAKEPNAGPRRNSDDIFVVLAFSGGGTRAAALSTGVLYQLAGVKFHLNPKTGQPCTAGPADPDCETSARSLLDEVDVISSVSGGSFTAAYYALNGANIFDRSSRFQKNFLYYPLQRDLFAQALFYPQNWRYLGTRTEIAAGLYDERVFERATYARLEHLSRPYIILNGTDSTTGARFEFSQEQFDLLCSDLSQVPIARGVTGSSAFPGLLNSLAIDSHNKIDGGQKSGCGYAGPGSGAPFDWVQLALQDRTLNQQRYRAAQDVLAYRDPARTTLHVLDGGLADNIGLRTVIQSLSSTDRPTQQDANGDSTLGGWSLLSLINNRRVKTLIVITVNARTKQDSDADQHAGGPSTIGVLGAASGIPMGNYSNDTLQLLESTLKDYVEPTALAGLSAHSFEVAFEDLPDNANAADSERHFFSNLPTSFELQPFEVDCLIDRGERLLRGSTQTTFANKPPLTFDEFVTKSLKGQIDPTGGPHPPACTDNAAKRELGIRSHYIDVGVQFGALIPNSHDVKRDHGPGLVVRITRPSGISATAEYTGESFDVNGTVNGSNVGLGTVGLRTILGGVAYTKRLSQLEATAGFALGYGFGHFNVSDATRDEYARQGLYGLRADSSNALVLAPRVSLWQNLSNRWAVGVTATYVHSKPTVAVASGDVVRMQDIDASAVRVSAGIAFKIF